jgi:hypothetical protein
LDAVPEQPEAYGSTGTQCSDEDVPWGQRETVVQWFNAAHGSERGHPDKEQSNEVHEADQRTVTALLVPVNNGKHPMPDLKAGKAIGRAVHEGAVIRAA